jgi:hypothetical protein
MPSERRTVPGCLESRDHVRTPGGSDASGAAGAAGRADGTGPSIGPAPGSADVVPGVPASPGPRSRVGDPGSLAAPPISPGADSGRGPTVPGPGAAPAGSPPDAGPGVSAPGDGVVLTGRGADSGLGVAIGGAGAVPADPGCWLGAGAVPAGPGSRSRAGSVADVAADCPALEPVAGAAALAPGSPASRAPAWPRRVSRAATARNRARPAPAPPRGPPPAGLPGSGSWPGAAAGAGERVASKSGAAFPASDGNSVMCRPRREIQARARPDRRPGPRR